MNDSPKEAKFKLEDLVVGVIPFLIVGLIAWYLWPSGTSKSATARENSTAKNSQAETMKAAQKDADWVRGMYLRSVERFTILNERNIVLIAVRHGLPPEKVHLIAEKDERDSLSDPVLEAGQLSKDKAIKFWTDKIAGLAKDSGLTEVQVATVLWDLSQAKDK